MICYTNILFFVSRRAFVSRLTCFISLFLVKLLSGRALLKFKLSGCVLSFLLSCNWLQHPAHPINLCNKSIVPCPSVSFLVLTVHGCLQSSNPQLHLQYLSFQQYPHLLLFGSRFLRFALRPQVTVVAWSFWSGAGDGGEKANRR